MIDLGGLGGLWWVGRGGVYRRRGPEEEEEEGGRGGGEGRTFHSVGR